MKTEYDSSTSHVKHQETEGLFPLVEQSCFFEATRASGYAALDHAIFELIDNSIEAKATRIAIKILSGATGLEVTVSDNGCGMSRPESSAALSFGGSSRFGSRSGLGRFGMGLPNASLSQARRVDIYSWTSSGECSHAWIDLDEILTGVQTAVSSEVIRRMPAGTRRRSATGTIVHWTRLDKASRAWSAPLESRLRHRIGRTYRRFLDVGLRVDLNHQSVTSEDPLFLNPNSAFVSRQFGDTMEVQLQGTHGHSGRARIRFTELPVEQLAGLPDAEKRMLGVSGRSGVSVLRAGREIDYGWFFIEKRRENYDDWWRCEIDFDPQLDEMFGVSHTKQGIRPTEAIWLAIAPDVTNVARELGRRARAAHAAYKQRQVRSAACRKAATLDKYLPWSPGTWCNDAGLERDYVFEVRPLRSSRFFSCSSNQERLQLTINETHHFYHEFMLPFRDQASDALTQRLELALLALARAEQVSCSTIERDALNAFIDRWSRNLTVFLGKR